MKTNVGGRRNEIGKDKEAWETGETKHQGIQSRNSALNEGEKAAIFVGQMNKNL